MPNSYKLNLVLLLLLVMPVAKAQTALNYAVMPGRQGNAVPVRLAWSYDSSATGYTIYRKLPGAALWGTAIGTTAAADTFFTDNITTSSTHEYYIRKSFGAGREGHGYILTVSGSDLPTGQGRILVLVDANYRFPLAAGITELLRDLAADGWYADTLVIGRSEPVTQVKQKIKNWYEQHRNDAVNPRSLYLLGHIPVPYSGDIFPDGHRPDHRGAWPADVYYGVMNETIWTDQSVNSDSAVSEANRNVPGDGKFDPDFIYPDTTSLEIGRVDLVNMPAFGQSDTALMQDYLQKAHAFKTTSLVADRKALVDDKFGAMNGEAFASSGWRNSSTIAGASNTVAAPFLASVKSGSYLLTYGCGPGTYQGVSGVVSTQQMAAAADSINTVFSMLFGSYLGDWNTPDNIMRAVLCSKPMGLASGWSGRPHWPMHFMGIGHTIGYCARITQNNMDGRFLIPASVSGYFCNSFPTYVHIALMGDPTLRAFYNPVPHNISATPNVDSSAYQLSWDSIPEAIGYEVYASQNSMHGGRKIGATTSATINIDDLVPGINHLYVRARYIETSASGPFQQLSLGGYYNVTGGVNATGIKEAINQSLLLSVYPNPSQNQFTLSGKFENAILSVYDVSGRLVMEQHKVSAGRTVSHALKPGLYLVRIADGKQTGVTRLVVGD